jgi:hypothetical protein
MTVIEELEQKIDSLTSRIKQSKKQLEDFKLDQIKLSVLAQASAESSIEKNTFLVNKCIQKLKKLKNEDINELTQKEKTKEEIIKKNYFKYQIQRIKRDKTRSAKEIENAFIIMDELPEEIELEDVDIFEIGNKSKELFLDIHSNLDDDLLEIKNEFLKLVENNFDETNNELKLLNYRIPIIILQLKILRENLIENINEINFEDFKGFPKFQDWWIHELWISHQAYLGLIKWKKIFSNLFISCEQKKAFENVFTNWILVKKILNVKGKSAYIYNYAFDKMIMKYTELREEQEEKNLLSVKSIVVQKTQEKCFPSISDKDILINDYLKFKIKKKNL